MKIIKIYKKVTPYSGVKIFSDFIKNTAKLFGKLHSHRQA
jgi:hypothetical protein